MLPDGGCCWHPGTWLSSEPMVWGLRAWMVLVSIYDDIKMWFPFEIRIWSPLEALFCLTMLGRAGAGEKAGFHLVTSAQRGKLEF